MGAINYKEYTIEFKIKGDNSANDSEIQQKLFYFQCELFDKDR